MTDKTDPKPTPPPTTDFRTHYDDLCKQRDAYAVCCTEMVLAGLWDTASAFARKFRETDQHINALLGLPREP